MTFEPAEPKARFAPLKALAGLRQAPVCLLLLAFVLGVALLTAMVEHSVERSLLPFVGLSTTSFFDHKAYWVLAIHAFYTPSAAILVLSLYFLLLSGPALERRWGSLKLVALVGAIVACTGVFHLTLETLQPLGYFSGMLGVTMGLSFLHCCVAPRHSVFRGFRVIHAYLLALPLAIVAMVALSPGVEGGPERASYLAHGAGLPLAYLLLGLHEGVELLVRRYRVHRLACTFEQEFVQRARVEQLLEKISQDGIGTLTLRERRELERASRFFGDVPHEEVPR